MKIEVEREDEMLVFISGGKHFDTHWLSSPEQAATILAHIKALQLDAMKEGARRAAEIANKNQYSMVSQVRNYILAAAEKWTEKDL